MLERLLARLPGRSAGLAQGTRGLARTPPPRAKKVSGPGGGGGRSGSGSGVVKKLPRPASARRIVQEANEISRRRNETAALFFFLLKGLERKIGSSLLGAREPGQRRRHTDAGTRACVLLQCPSLSALGNVVCGSPHSHLMCPQCDRVAAWASSRRGAAGGEGERSARCLPWWPQQGTSEAIGAGGGGGGGWGGRCCRRSQLISATAEPCPQWLSAEKDELLGTGRVAVSSLPPQGVPGATLLVPCHDIFLFFQGKNPKSPNFASPAIAPSLLC
jgi:hypothetical protein